MRASEALKAAKILSEIFGNRVPVETAQEWSRDREMQSFELDDAVEGARILGRNGEFASLHGWIVSSREARRIRREAAKSDRPMRPWDTAGRIPPADEIWRFKLSARGVIFCIALGSCDGNSQVACDTLFNQFLELPERDLRSWVADLEQECHKKNKRIALGFAEAVSVLPIRSGADELKGKAG